MKTISDRLIKFQLKEAKSDRATLIYILFRYDRKRFISSTGQTIEPYQWDKKRQRAIVDSKLIKNKRDRETNETINAHLERHRSTLLKVLNSLQLAQIPLDNDLIREHVDNALGKQKKPSVIKNKPITFIEYLNQFIEDAKSGKRLNTKSYRYAPVTIKAFGRIRSVLQRYNQASREGIDFSDFSIDYYHRLKAWMTEKGYSLNYVGSLTKDFKLLLKQSYSEGIHTNNFYLHRDYKRLAEEIDNIYLTSEELTKLYSLNLSEHGRLDRVRDLFLIGCYTGLRFSDFSELRPENITHNGQILTRKTMKTGEKVSIPLNQNIISILKKYEGGLPRTISNQRMNSYLKELCERAGFTELVELSQTKGGTRQTKALAKYELVTTHTARRSFATNAYLAGVPTVAIMKITGHKSESMFMKYIKVSSEQNALLLLQHPHFSKSDQ